MFDVITFGSATKDIMVKPRNLTVLKYDRDATKEEISFPLGSKIDVDQIEFNTGGGGTNTAATFSLQGFKTAFVGVVGQDEAGKEIIEELKRLKIDTKFVFKNSQKITNYSVVILNSDKEKTILAYRGASELLDKKDIPFKKLKTKWLYLAPLTGLLCDSFEELANFAKENNIKVAINPSIAQLSLPNFKDILNKIDILILNQEEASFLTKLPLRDEKVTVEGGIPQSAVKIFQKIDEMCPGVAVMTKGREGVIVSDGKYIYKAKPHQDRKIIDTTGAGDSFGAGFVAEFIRGNSNIEKSIQFGMANSQGCLSEIGAKNGLLKKGQPFEKVEVTKELIVNTNNHSKIV